MKRLFLLSALALALTACSEAPQTSTAAQTATTAESAQLSESERLNAWFEEKYEQEPLIALRNAPPELKDGTNRKGVLIGGFTMSEDGEHAVVVAAEDNLLKGAAVQAIQNVNIALGLEELKGIL